MANKGPINESELDILLQDLHLEENANVPNESMANFVLELEYPVTPDPKKESELLARLQTKSGGFGNGKFYSYLLVIGVVMIALFYFYSQKSKINGTHSNVTQQAITSSNTELHNSSNVNDPNNNSLDNSNNPVLKVVDTFGHPKKVVPIKTDTAIVKIKVQTVQKPVENEKSIPFLTEKDRLKYKHLKGQIIVNLIKFNKDLYTKIPAYKTDYAGKAIILDAFTIRNVGITNLEYKTFLADLLAQNRREDYLKCRVMNENWTKQCYYNLADIYFQDAAYNDFPVVNVSYDAAKLFCKWLEEETRVYMLQNNLKLRPLQVRLPYDEEWVFAAREGYAKIAFEKGYNTIYDEAVGLVNKSFTNRVELVKKRVERVDTLYGLYSTNRYGWSEKDMTDFFEVGLNCYKSGPLDTIYVERMKVLGKIGHVSEMIPQKNTSRLWLSGLSWKNKEEYQKLENEFKTNTSSPFVGFRVVVINPNDPEYKKPFW